MIPWKVVLVWGTLAAAGTLPKGVSADSRSGSDYSRSAHSFPYVVS